LRGFIHSGPGVGEVRLGVTALNSRVDGLYDSTGAITRSLSDSDRWGLLRPLRQDFLSLTNDFEGHVRHLAEAIDGAGKRLDDAAVLYSAAESACLHVLGAAGQAEKEGIRRLNPASRFYQEHRDLNGLVTAMPGVVGSLGAASLHTLRLAGDATSDDKYNIGTDLAMLVTDASIGLLSFRSDYTHLRTDPFGFLLRFGVPFLLNAFYWTKDVADRLTGDPIATGQAAYGFDSIAESCHRLAADLGTAIDQTLDAWQGTAADVARERLTDLRDGITDTAGGADGVAALLQLVSSLITDLETIVRGRLPERGGTRPGGRLPGKARAALPTRPAHQHRSADRARRQERRAHHLRFLSVPDRPLRDPVSGRGAEGADPVVPDQGPQWRRTRCPQPRRRGGQHRVDDPAVRPRRPVPPAVRRRAARPGHRPRARRVARHLTAPVATERRPP
jgi:hypothetical protein